MVPAASGPLAARTIVALAFVAFAVAAVRADDPAPSEPMPDLPVLYESDFAAPGAAEAWEPTDASAWEILEDEGRKVYALTGKSDYKPAVRSPLNISWLKGVEAGDFVLDVELKSTTGDYDHRDACLFFGGQGPSRFYYVHFGLKSDPHSNSIFRVNDAPRLSVAETRTTGTAWTNDYHRVRIVRDAAAGRIEVYFDDMTTPAMTTTDKTFASGRFGVGSFDDTANFAKIRIRGLPPADSAR